MINYSYRVTKVSMWPTIARFQDFFVVSGWIASFQPLYHQLLKGVIFGIFVISGFTHQHILLQQISKKMLLCLGKARYVWIWMIDRVNVHSNQSLISLNDVFHHTNIRGERKWRENNSVPGERLQILWESLFFFVFTIFC